MPWLANERVVDLMCRAAEARGWVLDVWWRDPHRLRLWWLERGWPCEYTSLGAVPSGDGFVAWCCCAQQEGDDWCWVVIALAPDEGLGPVVLHRDICDPATRQVPAHWVTQWGAAKALREPVRAPIRIEQWVGSHGFDGVARLGVAKAVDERGVPTAVEVSPGRIVQAKGLAKRWWGIDNRDVGCLWHWQRGQTEWPGYFQMVNALAREERLRNPTGFAASKDSRILSRKPRKAKEISVKETRTLAQQIDDLI